MGPVRGHSRSKRMFHVYLFLGIGLASGPAPLAIKNIAGAPLTAASPGSIAVLEGHGIAPQAGASPVATSRLPQSVDGLQVLVTVAGREWAASLLSVTPNRIEFLIPELPAAPDRITVRAVRGGSGTQPVSVAYAASSPAVIHTEGYPSITDTESREVRASDPLEDGREYLLYATGLGGAQVALYVDGVREEVSQWTLVTPGIYQVRFRHRGAGARRNAVVAEARLVAGGRETGFTVLAE